MKILIKIKIGKAYFYFNNNDKTKDRNYYLIDIIYFNNILQHNEIKLNYIFYNLDNKIVIEANTNNIKNDINKTNFENFIKENKSYNEIKFKNYINNAYNNENWNVIKLYLEKRDKYNICLTALKNKNMVYNNLNKLLNKNNDSIINLIRNILNKIYKKKNFDNVDIKLQQNINSDILQDELNVLYKYNIDINNINLIKNRLFDRLNQLKYNINSVKNLFIKHLLKIYNLNGNDYMNIIKDEMNYNKLRNILLKIIRERGNTSDTSNTINGFRNKIYNLINQIKTDISDINKLIKNLDVNMKKDIIDINNNYKDLFIKIYNYDKYYKELEVNKIINYDTNSEMNCGVSNLVNDNNTLLSNNYLFSFDKSVALQDMIINNDIITDDDILKETNTYKILSDDLENKIDLDKYNISETLKLNIDMNKLNSLFKIMDDFYKFLNTTDKSRRFGSLCDIFFNKEQENVDSNDYIMNNLKSTNYKKYNILASDFKKKDSDGNIYVSNEVNYNIIFSVIPKESKIINNIYLNFIIKIQINKNI